jgi:hypothetical protein
MNKPSLSKSECIAEAKKYTTAKDFRENAKTAYHIAYKHGWLRKFTWLKFAHRIKWTEESCRKAAMKYKELGKFQYGKDSSAYNAACRNGWLKTYTWLSRKVNARGTWTEKTCREEARKYRTRSEFRKGSPVACAKACETGWIKSYTWLAPPKTTLRWTYESCREAALSCSSKMDFKTKFPTAYTRARTYGWLATYDWLPLFNHKWTKEKCYELALTCKNRAEMYRKSNFAGKAALENGWFDDYYWFEKPTLISYDDCYEAAKKCTTTKEFRAKFYRQYAKSCHDNWLGTFTWLKRELPLDKRKIDSVYVYVFDTEHTVYVGRTVNTTARDIAHRTHNCPVRRFADSHSVPVPEMKILKRNLTLEQGLRAEDRILKKYIADGWNVINSASTGVMRGSLGTFGRKWSRAACMEEARKYATPKEFREGNASAYNAAYHNGWFDDYTWLEFHRSYWTLDMCIERAKQYSTLAEFRHKDNKAYMAVLRHGWSDKISWLKRDDR